MIRIAFVALSFSLIAAGDLQTTVHQDLPKKDQPGTGDGDGGAKKSDAVVKVTATSDKPDANGNQSITVTLSIDKGWHVYANPVPKDFPGIPTALDVIAKTKPEEVKIDYPKGKLVEDPAVGDHNVYEDNAVIKVKVKRAKGDTAPLELSLKIQACSDKQCLLPATVKLPIS